MNKLLYTFTFCLAFIFFSQVSYCQYILNGSATQETCNCYSLTSASQFQSGSVWQRSKINLSDSFDFTFSVYLGCLDDGADGIVFILQPDSTSIGVDGQGLGFQGIVPSIGVSLDTYQNLPYDPVYDHISIQRNGSVSHSVDLAGPLPASAVSDNIEDCAWHILRIKWDPVTYTLSTYFDGIFRLSTQTDIVKTIFNNDPLVYWGFSSSTGVQSNIHKFCTPLNCGFNSNLPNEATCFGDPVIFEDHSASFTTIRSYYWDFGDGTTSTNANPAPHNYAQPGIYRVKHTVQAIDGCTSPEAIKTIIIGDEPDASFNIYDTCQKTSPRIENNTTVKVGVITQWNWEIDGSILPNTAVPDLSNLSPGSHSIKLRVQSSAGCISNTVIREFKINNKPGISIGGKDGCINSRISFTSQQTDNLTTLNKWHWTFGDGQSSDDQNPFHSYHVKGKFPVELKSTATNGCTSTSLKNIFINAPDAFAGNDTAVIANTPFQLQGSGGDFYSWSPPTGLTNSDISNPIGTVTDDIKYILTVSTIEGCVDTSSIRVKVFKGSAIYVPTGFTPNNDGRNDFLRPAYIGIKSLLYFTIYNRWGEKVFSTNNLNVGWNGSLNGQNLNTDSFAWILKAIDITGKIYFLKGTFTLIR